jgi:hypothetical protein
VFFHSQSIHAKRCCSRARVTCVAMPRCPIGRATCVAMQSPTSPACATTDIYHDDISALLTGDSVQAEPPAVSVPEELPLPVVEDWVPVLMPRNGPLVRPHLSDLEGFSPMICVSYGSTTARPNEVTMHLIQFEPTGRVVAYTALVQGTSVLRAAAENPIGSFPPQAPAVKARPPGRWSADVSEMQPLPLQPVQPLPPQPPLQQAAQQEEAAKMEEPGEATTKEFVVLDDKQEEAANKEVNVVVRATQQEEPAKNDVVEQAAKKRENKINQIEAGANTGASATDLSVMVHMALSASQSQQGIV